MGKTIKYLIRVWFNTKVNNLFYWQGSAFKIDNSKYREKVRLDIIGKSTNIFGSKSWDNDMINSILDGFKGTNMKMIDKIEY